MHKCVDVCVREYTYMIQGKKSKKNVIKLAPNVNILFIV